MAALIRPRADADLPSCVAALRATHDADGYPAVWPRDPARWLTSRRADSAARVATVDGRVVGHVALVCGKPTVGTPTAALVRLFVHPDARGDGVGTVLISAALDHVRDRRLRAVLEVADSGAAAIRSYERHGFRRVGQRRADWTQADGRRPMVFDYMWNAT